MISTIMPNATEVTAIATLVTTIFIGMQWYTSKKVRKDHLFKIRYEFYLEICEYIKKTL